MEGVGCFCFGGGGDNTKERLLLIKGPFCFVFSSEEAASPKYAVGLQSMRANVKLSGTVLLENNLGGVQYELHFESKEAAKKISQVVREQAATADAELVRKRLGHEALLVKRSSERCAYDIALEKTADQPDVPITTREVMESMPVPAM